MPSPQRAHVLFYRSDTLKALTSVYFNVYIIIIVALVSVHTGFVDNTNCVSKSDV